jgi:hypothetical protein
MTFKDEDDFDDDGQAFDSEDGVTYACEDCDHRWELAEWEQDSGDFMCPMCGSDNIVEL